MHLHTPTMRYSRRHLLSSTALGLSCKIIELLTTPLGKWTGTPLVQAATAPSRDAISPVTFVDVAQQAGLTSPNVWGGVKSKKYLLEAKGNGLAFFDFDNDGWLDVYLTNGVRFGESYPPNNAPISHLYKNNRDGKE